MTPEKKPRPPLPRQTVLVIDDEQEIRNIMVLGLQPHFEVETAGSTQEAEFLLGTKNYDAIVCDHLMPDEEGMTFLIRARERFPKVQRILVTGYINPELLSRSTGVAGLAGVLMKPVNMAELIQTIRFAVPR